MGKVENVDKGIREKGVKRFRFVQFSFGFIPFCHSI